MTNIKISKVVTTKIKGLQEQVQNLKITTPEENQRATELLAGIRKFKKLIKQEMDKYIIPAKEIIKATKEKYDPYINEINQAEARIKAEMERFYLEQKKAEEKKKEQIAKRVEKGTMKVETAVKKMSEVQTAEKTVKTNEGTASVRMVKTVEFAELNLLKDEDIIFLAKNGYLTWNKTQARKDALAGKELPGVIVEEKPSIAIRA